MNAGNIIALVISLLTAGGLIAWIKLGPELRLMNTDTAARYQEIADKAAKRLTDLENQLDEMRAELDGVKDELSKANREGARFRDWAERLHGQVISLGAVPVELNPSPTKPRSKE